MYQVQDPRGDKHEGVEDRNSLDSLRLDNSKEIGEHVCRGPGIRGEDMRRVLFCHRWQGLHRLHVLQIVGALTSNSVIETIRSFMLR